MSTALTPDAPPAQGVPFWSSRSALVMPALLVAVAVFLVVGIAGMEVADDSELFGPKAFPTLVVVVLLVVAALLTVSILRNPEVAAPVEGADGETVLPTSWRSLAVTVGSVAVFIALLETAGWIVAAAILFAGVATGLGSRRYLLNIGVGLAISSVVQLVFVGLLGLALPAGIMGVF